MKISVLTAMLLCFTITCLAQNKQEKYCLMSVYKDVWKNTVYIELDSGQGRSIYVDTLGKKPKAVEFKSLINAFNFMVTRGWRFQSSLLAMDKGTYQYPNDFIFKKEIDSTAQPIPVN